MREVYNQLNLPFLGLVIILLICGAYIISSMMNFKDKLYKQNIQLIKSYLDKKLISKLLEILANPKNDTDILKKTYG